MKKFLLGEKIGMTQVFTEEGLLVPVTVLRVGKSTVVSVDPVSPFHKTATVTLGYGDLGKKSISKPLAGIFLSKSISPKRFLRSFKSSEVASYGVGDELSIDHIADLKFLSVRSVSSGKGFAGTIKRHNFSRGPRSHGSKNYRAPGSIGAGTTPGRVLKGKRMAGRMGNAKVTVLNLKVVKVDSQSSLLYLQGAVPGKGKSIIELFS